MNRLRTKKHILTLCRLLIGVALALALIYLTLRRTDTQLWHQLQDIILPFIGACFAFYGIMLVVGAIRWQLLLRVQGITIPFFKICRLQLIGFFFNLAVPSAVGGDVVKMGYAFPYAPARKTEIVFSIIIDRVLGLMGLFTIAGIAVLLAIGNISELGNTIKTGAYIVALASLSGIALFLGMEFHEQILRHRWIVPIINFMRRKLPESAMLVCRKLITGLDMYRQARKTLAVAFALSICVHTCLAMALLTTGWSLGGDELEVREYFVTAQVANAIASAPITPGGLGVRDKSSQEFLLAFGMPPGKSGAIPVTLTLVILSWALIGAVVFIFTPRTGNLQDLLEHQPPIR